MSLTTVNAGPSVERIKAIIAKLDPQPESVMGEVSTEFLDAMRLEAETGGLVVPSHWTTDPIRFVAEPVPWRQRRDGTMLMPTVQIALDCGTATATNPEWVKAPREIVRLFCRYPGNLAAYEFVSFLRQP